MGFVYVLSVSSQLKPLQLERFSAQLGKEVVFFFSLSFSFSFLFPSVRSLFFFRPLLFFLIFVFAYSLVCLLARKAGDSDTRLAFVCSPGAIHAVNLSQTCRQCCSRVFDWVVEMGVGDMWK